MGTTPTTLSKEEILSNCLLSQINNIHTENNYVYEAMDVFSKQECIAFAEWIKGSEYQPEFIAAFLPNEWKHEKTGEHITTEQLHQLYIQSKQ